MINRDILQQYVDNKLVSVQKHPDADLFIYNYTPKVQYEKLWDEITLQCRGLILDRDNNVVARPFKKFFNYQEHDPMTLPAEPFEVFEKMDGSLGILYWIDDAPHIATRGSFTSDQAKHATNLLHTKYEHIHSRLDRSKTYLFEIIYPENRIVVDYEGWDDLVLLTAIDNKTGEEHLPYIGFPVVIKHGGLNEMSKINAVQEDNKEGFVIRFKSGLRVKIKFDEYVRLHRIITGVSNIAIWEYLKDGKPLDELLDRVPDEFYQWVKGTVAGLKISYESILNHSKAVFKEYPTRKETALYFQTQKRPAVLFSMLDGKSPEKIIWRMLRPAYSKPFKTEVEC